MAVAQSRSEIRITAALFLIPMFAGLAVFQWLPLGVAVWNSLLRFSPLNPDLARFVGLENYLTVLTTERFMRAIFNTLLYISGTLLIQVPLGLALALLLNQPLRGRTVARAAVIAALAASETIVAVLFNLMYNPDNGLFNALLHMVHIPAQSWLVSQDQALLAILLMTIWKNVGLSLLILLAGLQLIPREFYEAAALDGASALQRLRLITLPLLIRMIVLASFMATIDGGRILSPILLMTEGGPEDASVNAVYYSYEQAFRYQRMGEALATAVLLVGLLICITLVQGRFMRARYEY